MGAGLLTPIASHSQQSPASSQEAELHFSRWFDEAIGLEHTPLLQGVLYTPTLLSKTSHPFLGNRTYARGDLRFENQLYASVSLLFDLEKELLVIQHPNPIRKEGISIDMDRLEWFRLQGHYFSRLPLAPERGFFDVLHVGDSLLFVVKRIKEFQVEREGVAYKEAPVYFVQYRQQLHALTSNRSLKSIFRGQTALLRQIRRQEKLRFTLRNEPQMVLFIQSLDRHLNP